ncbi:MAG: flotillin-like FloA family protein [Aeoliella sp.]
MSGMDGAFLIVVLAGVAICGLLFVLVIFAMLVRPWLRAVLHRAPVLLPQILAMRLRGNPPLLLIDAYITLRRAGISTTIDEVENVYIDSSTRVSTSDNLVELVKQRTHVG